MSGSLILESPGLQALKKGIAVRSQAFKKMKLSVTVPQVPNWNL